MCGACAELLRPLQPMLAGMVSAAVQAPVHDSTDWASWRALLNSPLSQRLEDDIYTAVNIVRQFGTVGALKPERGIPQVRLRLGGSCSARVCACVRTCAARFWPSCSSWGMLFPAACPGAHSWLIPIPSLTPCTGGAQRLRGAGHPVGAPSRRRLGLRAGHRAGGGAPPRRQLEPTQQRAQRQRRWAAAASPMSLAVLPALASWVTGAPLLCGLLLGERW